LHPGRSRHDRRGRDGPGPGDRIIDCRGRTIVPGLIDAHFPATERTVEYVSHGFYRIAGGLIAEEWICSDTASPFRQLS
jgi:cytosine/adenosine deaminase-related metal-dependent hydrolase